MIEAGARNKRYETTFNFYCKDEFDFVKDQFEKLDGSLKLTSSDSNDEEDPEIDECVTLNVNWSKDK